MFGRIVERVAALLNDRLVVDWVDGCGDDEEVIELADALGYAVYAVAVKDDDDDDDSREYGADCCCGCCG